MKKEFSFICLVLTLFLFSGFGCESAKTLAKKRRADLEYSSILNAFKSLVKIESAIEVGVNYQNYGALLIDAKSAVNEAIMILPDKETGQKFDKVVGIYSDASKIWNRKIGSEYFSLRDSSEPGKTLIPKYSLPAEKDAYSNDKTVDPDLAMQLIWAKATTELATLWPQVEGKLWPELK